MTIDTDGREPAAPQTEILIAWILAVAAMLLLALIGWAST